MSNFRTPTNSNLTRILGAAGLVVAALVVLILTLPMVFQAFRGPRPITEQELLAIQEPGSWDNYVRFKPSGPAAAGRRRHGPRPAP